jgi:hypothetical protein
VDGIAYPLHHPTVCSHETREQGFLSDAAMSYRAAVGGGAFPGDAKLPSLDIQWRVDRLGTCVTKSLHGVDCFLPWHAYPMSEPSWCLCVYPWSSYCVRRR